MKIYYAHSKKIYDGKREEKELAIIQNKYPSAEIVNPSETFRREIEWRMFMAFDLPNMDLVIFSGYNGYIGKGVYAEILAAIDNEIPVLYLNGEGKITALFAIGEPNPDDWVYHCKILPVA
jgi:hypothetical protein